MTAARQHALPGLPVSGSHAARLRQHTGADAERAVEAAHRACVLAGLASPLLRLDAGVRMGPGGRAVVRESAALDYACTLRGGRSCVLEVKSLDGPRWEYRKLAPHQRQALAEQQALGALTLVIVVSPTTLYTLPWYDVASDLAAGVVSISSVCMHPWAVRPGRPYLHRFLEEMTR